MEEQVLLLLQLPLLELTVLIQVSVILTMLKVVEVVGVVIIQVLTDVV